MTGEHLANAPSSNSETQKRAATTVYTSTPKAMDGIHEQTYLQGLDNDSGYVSHNHESNLESTQADKLIVENPVYMSEDTLLEEPKSQSNPEVTKSVYEEFTNVYYLNTILDSSGGTTGLNYSGLMDSSASSSGLNVSPELNLLQPIVTTKDKLNIFPPANDASPAFLIDHDSNGENNPNVLNNVNTTPQKKTNTGLLNKTPQKREGQEVFNRSLTPRKKFATPKKLNSCTKVLNSSKKSLNNFTNSILNSNNVLKSNILQSSNSNVLQSSNNNILQSSNCNVLQSSNNNILQNSNCNILQSSNNNVLQSSNSNVLQSSNNNVLQSSNSNILQSSINNILQSSNSNLLQSSNLLNSNVLNKIPQFNNSIPQNSNLLQNEGAFKNFPLSSQNSVLNTSNKINILNNKKVSPIRKRKRSLSKTPQKQQIKSFNSDHSPDMFSDEDEEVSAERVVESAATLGERYVLECDKCLVKRVGDTLGGVLPPPSYTTLELSVGEMLEKIKENEEYFWGRVVEKDVSKRSTLLVNTDLETCLSKKWPEILEQRFHGVHHNRSKLSEELESLCSRYSQRYVGAETQSSCTVFDVRMSSPSKRKSNRLRWAAKSPGRRLSHLARRRITFSSANLQAGVATSSSARQVMMDAKRYELLIRKSPRKNKSPRKTPRKSPRKAVRTPKSSAKKRLSLSFQQDAKAGPSSATIRASATKRALFQSPDKKLTLLKSRNMPSTSNPTTSPWKKKTTPKRALFCSPSKISPTNKRKRLDSDDIMPTKIARSLSMQSDLSNSSISEDMGGVSRLQTSRSDSNLTSSYHSVELSAHHKKKLQWAVYEALRSQHIGLAHPQFKQFATVLARVTRKLLPNPATTVKTEGTSERFLRIAKRHVFAVSKGKTVEEIIQAYEAARVKVVKPTGYVSKEAAATAMDVSIARSRDSAFQDKANTLNREKSNDVSAAKSSRQAIGRPENKIERVKKIINFDDDGSRYSFR